MKPTLFQGALSHIALFLLSEGMTLDRNIVIEQGCFAFNYVVGSLFHSFFFIIAKNFSDPENLCQGRIVRFGMNWNL